MLATAIATMAALSGATQNIGERLEPFSLPRQQGPIYSWKPGTTTVICVVAYWCDTWKDQLARLADVRKRVAGQPVDFVVVSIDGRWTALSPECPWADRLTDPEGKWSFSHGLNRVPYTLVCDPAGKVQFSQSGVVRPEAVVRAIEGARNAPDSATPDPVVYLTFDDFPSKSGDFELLDILRREQVPATFFAIGTNLKQSPESGKRAAREGHSLQIHGWEHDADRVESLKVAALVKGLTGQTPRLVRKPGSSVIEGLSVAPPVVNPFDYLHPDADELIRRVSNAVKPGAVVQLHTGVSVTRQALPELIRLLRQRGYRFDVLR